MKSKLIILNGPCGIGKNVIAEMYKKEHIMSQILDIDDIRRSIDNYQKLKSESYVEACNLIFTKTEECLCKGYDVIIPNLIRKPGVLVSFEKIAKKCDADFFEFVLWTTKEDALKRAIKRGFRPESLLQENKLAGMYDELEQMLKVRKNSLLINSQEGKAKEAYDEVISVFTNM